MSNRFKEFSDDELEVIYESLSEVEWAGDDYDVVDTLLHDIDNERATR